MQHHRRQRCRLVFSTVGAAAFALMPLASARAADAADRARAAGEKQRYAPALLARLKRAPIPYALYARPPFETILPDSTPAPAEAQAAPKLRILVCAEETEPTALAVFAGKDLKNATLKMTGDLFSESKQSRLPRTALDIHVVTSLTRKGAGTTPELLVKDDRTPLTGGMPAVRLTGDPQTDVPAGASKQFWITVRVAKGQSSALLSGSLVFSATGVKPTSIPLTVEVLPMRLRTPFLQYGMDFRSRLSSENPRPGQPVVSGEVFARQLADIRDHGFRFVSLYDPPSALADPLRMLREANLNPAGPVVVQSPVRGRGDVEQVERLRAEVGLRPDFEIYYGLPGEDVEAARRAAGAIHEVNRRALTVASIMTQAAYEALDGILDVPVYGVGADYSRRLLTTGKRENPKRDWWSWNIAGESKQMNRLYAGYLLYRTGINSSPLYGAFAGPYQVIGEGGDPYADAEAALVAYPAQGGVIDTLQWEAAREGVDDIRYITNLKTYIREIKDLKVRPDATEEAEAFLSATMKKPLVTLSAGELQRIRVGVANRAIALLTILRQNAKRYPD